MSYFQVTFLTNGQAIVEGSDDNGVKGSRIVSTATYNNIAQAQAVALAQDQFDAEVTSFYAPLTQAAEAFEEAQQVQVNGQHPDALFVLQEGTQGSPARPTVTIDRGTNPIDGDDALLIHLVEKGQFEDLICVPNESGGNTIMIKAR